MLIRIQPSEEIDNLTADGHEMTKLPYPFYVTDEGKIDRQDFWQGNPFKVIGFQTDLAAHQIDLWWADAVKNVSRMIGMYLVTSDSQGQWSVHMTAIASAEVLR